MADALLISKMQYISCKEKHNIKNALKYYTYRDDRNQAAIANGGRRWIDRGLGENRKDIQKTLDQLKSDKVAAWMWVISPAPDLMAEIPLEKRHDFIVELTDDIVGQYHEERNMHVPEYAMVVHDRETKEKQSQTHTHVMLPGTTPTALGRERMMNYRDHIELFNTIAEQQMEQHLDQAIGREWRNLRSKRQEIAANSSEQHATELPASDDLDEWFPRENENNDYPSMEIDF